MELQPVKYIIKDAPQFYRTVNGRKIAIFNPEDFSIQMRHGKWGVFWNDAQLSIALFDTPEEAFESFRKWCSYMETHAT